MGTRKKPAPVQVAEEIEELPPGALYARVSILIVDGCVVTESTVTHRVEALSPIIKSHARRLGQAIAEHINGGPVERIPLEDLVENLAPMRPGKTIGRA